MIELQAFVVWHGIRASLLGLQSKTEHLDGVVPSTISSVSVHKTSTRGLKTYASQTSSTEIPLT